MRRDDEDRPAHGNGTSQFGGNRHAWPRRHVGEQCLGGALGVSRPGVQRLALEDAHRLVVGLRPGTELGAVVAVEGDLADTYGRRSYLEALVLAAELEGLLQRQVPCRHEPVELVRSSPTHGSYPLKMWCIIPVPRVSVRNSVRKPMRPRAGTMYSMRTQPVPWLTICSRRPRRRPRSRVTTPR